MTGRLWLEAVRINGKPWDKTPPAPRLPDEVIAKTAAKYQEALTRLMAWTVRLVRADLIRNS